jgi:DNA-binding MarR family transcriptional regulator
VEPSDPKKLARNSDVSPSHEAAAGHVKSGQNEAQRKLILAAVVAKPGSTVDELAGVVGIDQHRVGKRLSDLENQFYITKGRPRLGVSGRLMSTWWPTEIAKGS